jgi:hypothetical protein
MKLTPFKEPEASLQYSQKATSGPWSHVKLDSVDGCHVSEFQVLGECNPIISDLRTQQGHLITIIFDEEYKFGSSSLCIFLQPPVTSSLEDPNIPLSFCSQTPTISVFSLGERLSFIPIRMIRCNCSFLYTYININVYVFQQQTGRQKLLN